MAYFADLTPHSYSATDGLEILNIGWLDTGQPFPTGPTSQEFHAALGKLCEHPIFLHRGVHFCWFCHGQLQSEAGNGQIRVLSRKGDWYAAPTLVHHYVLSHEYSPPADFIDAVLSPVAQGTEWQRYARMRRTANAAK